MLRTRPVSLAAAARTLTTAAPDARAKLRGPGGPTARLGRRPPRASSPDDAPPRTLPPARTHRTAAKLAAVRSRFQRLPRTIKPSDPVVTRRHDTGRPGGQP